MSEKMMGIDPEIKKKLNSEGFDEEGGAAVVVGNKEERELAKRRLENEGRVNSVEAYINLHREKILSKGEINSRLIPESSSGKKIAWLGTRRMFFVDDGNVFEVNFDPKKIESLRGIDVVEEGGKIREEIDGMNEFEIQPDHLEKLPIEISRASK